MCFVRAMDSIELSIFPEPELSQKITDLKEEIYVLACLLRVLCLWV